MTRLSVSIPRASGIIRMTSTIVSDEALTVYASGLGLGLGATFELLGEVNIVDERPRIVKLAIPRPL